jgi:hypothetical protein
MFNVLRLGIALVGAVFAFGFARGFVRRRLRFVDAVRSPLAPVVAGGIAALVAWPLTLLPLVTGLAAALVGIGAGMGTASGVKALRSGD